MTAEELMAELSALSPTTKVYLYADHGQNYEGASSIREMDAYNVEDPDLEVDEIVAVIYGW